MILCTEKICGQIPVNDPAWQLDTTKSEEFNSTLDFTNKWREQSLDGYSWGAEWYYPANIIHNTGDTVVKLKADTLSAGYYDYPSRWWKNYNGTTAGVTYAYQSGAFRSQNTDYHFGYIEASCKMPSSGNWPYWPAFWLWHADCTPNYYNEIDIAEPGAEDSYYGNQYGTGVWINVDSCGAPTNYPANKVTGISSMSTAFHKYAVQWTPNRITWYFDDLPVVDHYDASGLTIPQNPMMLFFDFALETKYAFLPSDWPPGTNWGGAMTPVSWPAYFTIDYMRYYTLNCNCTSSLPICNPSTDYSNRDVRLSITTGGGCTSSFNGNTPVTSYTLRATDYVLLDEGTTIDPSGTGYFAIETMACPQ